jgi:hypothetical protein
MAGSDAAQCFESAGNWRFHIQQDHVNGLRVDQVHRFFRSIRSAGRVSQGRSCFAVNLAERAVLANDEQVEETGIFNEMRAGDWKCTRHDRGCHDKRTSFGIFNYVWIDSCEQDYEVCLASCMGGHSTGPFSDGKTRLRVLSPLESMANSCLRVAVTATPPYPKPTRG